MSNGLVCNAFLGPDYFSSVNRKLPACNYQNNRFEMQFLETSSGPTNIHALTIENLPNPPAASVGGTG